MPRIDPLIESLLCENGTELTLETGKPAVLTLPGGRISPIPKPLGSQQIRSAIGELAPADTASAIASGGDMSFTYRHSKGTVEVSMTARGATVLARVVPHVPKPAPPPKPAERDEDTRKKPRSQRKRAPPTDDEDTDDSVVMDTGNAAPVLVMPPASSMLPHAAAPRTEGPAARMDVLLDQMIDEGASDVHLTTGSPPFFRVDGDMKPASGWKDIPLDELTAMVYSILPQRNRKEFEAKADTDCAWENARSRFRVNVFMERHGIGCVIRQIPNEIRTAESLGLSKAIIDLCKMPKGLVLVTGPTGSGKSTTLAALIDYVNRTRSDHIITIEDPVEFVHPHKKCVVHQREVGVHTESFKKALRAALREDPDVVLVGEMRDLETVAIAIETAETGHLVFGTLHTNTAPSTVDRIIDQFPAERQAQIRIMLSETLRAVITQTLCKKIGGGRIPVMEILLVTPAVANLIREGKTFQIPSMMQTSRNIGMITQTDALFELVQRKRVDPREALQKAVAKVELRQLLEREGYRTE